MDVGFGDQYGSSVIVRKRKCASTVVGVQLVGSQMISYTDPLFYGCRLQLSFFLGPSVSLHGAFEFYLLFLTC